MSSSEGLKPKHIVVINAEADFLIAVRSLLEDEGYTVSTIHVFEEPFKLVIAEQPAAIVLDFVYEKPEAWQLLTELDSDPRTREIPLLATSTDAEIVERVLARISHRHASGMLVKPMELDALVEAVNRLTAE
ncbi:hypothetical protein BH09CHL1_BH09CHL1_03180 [soil metagenome]